MILALVTGGAAGLAMGYVLMRGQLCFHSMFAGAWERRGMLLRAWILAVAVASVGLSVLYRLPASKGLNTGLAFVPVANIAGGVIVGTGMVVASSCVSGLLFKLGSGMLGALAGIAGWIAGEAAVRHVRMPGPVELTGGFKGTFASVLGVPRLSLSLVFLAVVLLVQWRVPATETEERPSWQWGWRTLGLALGLVTVADWVLARLGHSSFGPSSVGATASVLAGHPNWWLIAFLASLVGGGTVAATTAGGFVVRGEQPVRYVRLAIGGFLLGAGGWIGGGCNLGHGLSGVAQLNVSSWIMLTTMALTVGALRALGRAVTPMVVRAPA